MTSIQWTDKTWNPVTGCDKVSPGCKHCYAEGIADRFFAKQYPPNADGSVRRFTDVRCHPERLQDPLHWKKPCMVFVNSMSDLFHEGVSEEFIQAVFTTMAMARQHTFQVLTKRPHRMLEVIGAWKRNGLLLREGCGCVLPNVWLGVSVENQKYADERIPLLVRTPAKVRFLSVEPQLEHVRLQLFNPIHADGEDFPPKPQINWVICGGESGPGARPFNLAWAESLLRQCQAAGVPFFMKQVGSNTIADLPKGLTFRYTGGGVKRDRKGGDPEEWPEHLRVREFPRTA